MAIRISEVKSWKLSDDNKEIIVDSTGKYTGDLELRFARECLDQLLQMLTQARDGLEPSAKPAAVPGVVQPPVAPPNEAPVVAPKTNPDEVRFEIPKNFTVTADTSDNVGLYPVLFSRSFQIYCCTTFKKETFIGKNFIWHWILNK